MSYTMLDAEILENVRKEIWLEIDKINNQIYDLRDRKTILRARHTTILAITKGILHEHGKRHHSEDQ